MAAYSKQSWFLSALLTVIMVVACAPAYAKKTPESVTLQLKWYHQFQFAGYYAAVEKGFYLEEGLDVTIIEGGPTTKVDQLVNSGEAHYGVLASELIEKRLQGEPLVMLAVIMQHSIRTLITRSDSAIATPSDLINRPIMLNPNEQIEYLAMFANQGIKQEDLVIIDKDSSANEALISGEVAAIDGSVANQPFIFSQTGVNVRTIRPIDYGIDFYGDALFTSERELRYHPTRCAAFRRASIRGWHYAMEHPDEMIELIVTKYNPRKSRAQLQFEAHALELLILPKLIDIGHVSRSRIERIATTYANFGLVPHDHSLDGFIYVPSTPINYRWILWGLAVVGSGVAILLLFNRRLHTEVKQQTQRLSNKNIELEAEINKRKQAQLSLHNSEEVLRATLESTLEGILVIDASGNISHYNDRFSHIFSIPAKVLDSNKDSVLLNYIIDKLSSPDHFLTRIKHINATSDIATDRLRLKDGRIIDRFTTPLIRAQRERGRVWCFNDVTATISAHELTKKLLAQAEEAHDNIDEILKAVPQGLVVTDLAGKIILTNHSAEKLLGKSQNQLFQHSLCTIVNNKSFCDQLDAALTGQHTIPAIEIAFHDHHKGQQSTMQLQTSLVKNSDGKSHGAIILFHDVTTEREIAQMKNEFISTAAHELNTPLSAVMGYAELLLNNWQNDLFDRDQQEEFLGVIYQQCERLTNIVDELLQLGEFEFGQSMTLNKSPLDLNHLIAETVKQYQAGKYAERIHFLPSTSSIKLDGDAKKLTQALENLLSNSVKYSASPSPISVSCAAKESHCQIVVKDEGIGMTTDQQQRMFEKFYRADTSTTAIGGLGLGATIVKNIVEAHNGQINVESSPNTGTTITINLPTLPL